MCPLLRCLEMSIRISPPTSLPKSISLYVHVHLPFKKKNTGHKGTESPFLSPPLSSPSPLSSSVGALAVFFSLPLLFANKHLIYPSLNGCLAQCEAKHFMNYFITNKIYGIISILQKKLSRLRKVKSLEQDGTAYSW